MTALTDCCSRKTQCFIWFIKQSRRVGRLANTAGTPSCTHEYTQEVSDLVDRRPWHHGYGRPLWILVHRKHNDRLPWGTPPSHHTPPSTPPVPPGLPQASRYLLFFWVTASLVSNSAALSCCARCFFTQRDLDAQHVTDVTILTQISVWPCDFFKSQEKMKENSVSVSLLSPYLFILWWYLLCLSVGRQRSWRGRPGCCDKLRNTFI